jgi:PKD repeat protein
MRLSRHPRASRRLPLFMLLATISLVPSLAPARALAIDAPPAEIEASDKAPKARLVVTNVWTPLFTVLADGSGSTDTDATPIATYRFEFGDGTAPVDVAAPASTVRHTYAKAAKYKVKLIAIDTAGKKSSSISVTIKVTAPPPDKPPVAKLKLTRLTNTGLVVSADGSGSTDADATPVASYRFDFGDGTPPVVTTAPTASATHTYTAGGKYTVQLIATDTGGNPSKPVTASVTAIVPPEKPPVAQLVVSKATLASLEVTADASRSSDDDLTPVASYRFDFGDRTPPVVTAAPVATAKHTYAAQGPYTVSLIATDSGGHASAPVTVTIFAGTPPPPKIAVYTGYYDTHHPARTQPKPSPWMGSPNVVFVGKPDGSSGGWDSSCLRIENLATAPLADVLVTVDIGKYNYNLWGKRSIPAGQSLILAQTGMENFDGSDTNPAGCYGCNPSECATRISKTVPVVHVSINGVVTDFLDRNQVLNTRGVDGAGCPATGTRNDESHAWERISPEAAARIVASSEDALIEGEAWFAPPFPNPARGEVDLSFRTATRGFVKLAVYDVSGRLLRTEVDRVLEAGVHRQRIDLSGASPGIYFCDLSTPQGVMKKSFVLMR